MVEASFLPTPLTTHLGKEYPDVYDPAEDTFILLDALEADLISIRGSRLCVEIGSGSGCVSSFLSTICGVGSALHLTTDISSSATLCTAATATLNKTPLDPIRTDLLASLLPRLRHSVDVLVFNPPYVETNDDEVVYAQGEGRGGIEGAWTGGESGMVVTERVLELVEGLLSSRGRFYLVAIDQNHPQVILEQMRSRGLEGNIVLSRRAGIEHLHILRFTRP